MKILIIGADGYLGWPTAMALSSKGHEVVVFDNFSKRKIELEEGVGPLWHVPTLNERIKNWKALTSHQIILETGDLINDRFVYNLLNQHKPDAIIHYGEQPSAPYSMKGLRQAVFTQHNNVIGNLNLLFAIKSCCPDTHLIKLGTMGEYGTPNIDIEEGYLDIMHNGREDTVLFPKKPFSFYHLSKVHDSNNIYFVCKNWNLRATDLNQGYVYGIDTDETILGDNINTSFHYDDIFGTVLNRFCVQAVAGIPLTVYGKGQQKRACLNIKDTIKCVEIAIENPANHGEYRVFNQFTETFSINELAKLVQDSCHEFKIDVQVDHIKNPRIEAEEHYYNPKNNKLLELGLKPNLLSSKVIKSMVKNILNNKDNINRDIILPKIKWKAT